MEQLLIQATILRAKRLARQLQDARANSSVEGVRFPALSLDIEPDNKGNNLQFHDNPMTYNAKKDIHFSSSSVLLNSKEHLDPTAKDAAKTLAFFNLPPRMRGKPFVNLS